MMLFRNICFYLLIAPITIIFALIATITIVLPFKYRYRLVTIWSYLFILLSKLCLKIDYKLEGETEFPSPAIIISNHQSMWETVFTQLIFPLQSWILKKELLWIPFFGWGLKLLQPVAIDRSDKMAARELLYQEGIKRLKAGRSIVIFPEGTRVAIDGYKKFSKSGVRLALLANMPIIPMAHNAGSLWPRGFFAKKSGVIKVYIGKAINPEGKTVEELNTYIENLIRQKMQEFNG